MLWDDVTIELDQCGFIRIYGSCKVECNYTLVKLLDKLNEDVNIPRKTTIEAKQPQVEWQTVWFNVKDLRNIMGGINSCSDSGNVSIDHIAMKFKGMNVVVNVKDKRVLVQKATSHRKITEIMHLFEF